MVHTVKDIGTIDLGVRGCHDALSYLPPDFSANHFSRSLFDLLLLERSYTMGLTFAHELIRTAYGPEMLGIH
jgi:hypothetical protein